MTQSVTVGSRWAGLSGNLMEILNVRNHEALLAMVGDNEDQYWEDIDLIAENLRYIGAGPPVDPSVVPGVPLSAVTPVEIAAAELAQAQVVLGCCRTCADPGHDRIETFGECTDTEFVARSVLTALHSAGWRILRTSDDWPTHAIHLVDEWTPAADVLTTEGPQTDG